MIELPYGTYQQFRYRHGDLNIIGHTDAVLPAKKSVYRLNDADEVHFYIEPVEKESDPPAYPYGMRTPSCHRLRSFPGYFNLEIPVSDVALRTGSNELEIIVIDFNQEVHTTNVVFDWESQPVELPLLLTDLDSYDNIQVIGQAVNGLFELDRTRNVIRSGTPVGSDVLLLLGSPNQSQEATYCVEFSGIKGIYLGLSDFFSGHVAQSSSLGIKPGYCTAGLTTVNSLGDAQVWISWGDNLMNHEGRWVVRTNRGGSRIDVKAGVKYRVRHQVLIANGRSLCRFRMWREGTIEPKTWLCQEHSGHINEHLPCNHAASFGLFQYFGKPTEWSDIMVVKIEPDPEMLESWLAN